MWHNASMMSDLPLHVWIVLALAALLTLAWALVVFGERLTRIWRTATPLGRASFAFAAIIATLIGGTKPNPGDEGQGGSNPTNPPPLGMGAPAPSGLLGMNWNDEPYFDPTNFPAVTPEDIARGWQCMRVITNATYSFAMPDGTTPCMKWWLHGAYEDVLKVKLTVPRTTTNGNDTLGDDPEEDFYFPIGNDLYTSIWAHTWGKIRGRLMDGTNEIAAVGGPIAAVPSISRFWSSASDEDSILLTWQDFTPGRALLTTDSSSPATLSAQLELKRNGDFVARSNEVAWLCRHISPTDWDGDGWRNEDDPHPYQWDLFGNGFSQNMPEDADESCYYWIDIRTEVSGRVKFTGDAPSNLPDPDFEARAGETYRVELLIGKEYSVSSAGPISVIDRSSSDIEVHRHGATRFNVVWPVTIDVVDDEPLMLMAAPSDVPAPLMAASGGSGGFFVVVTPDWLGGTVDWPTSTCCQIVGGGDSFSFLCSGDCGCGGCSFEGNYTYEGYTIRFMGAECGCTPHEHEDETPTTVGFSAPTVVFKDGALRPLSVGIEHGDVGSVGTLTLEREGAQSKIRIWADEHKHSAATQFSWDVASFNGCTYWVEGIEASGSVDDIEFRLVWERDGQDDAEYPDATTCAELKETTVSSAIPNGSPNPPPFDGNTRYSFDESHSPTTDKHWSVLYKDVVNNDFTVRDFDVDMTLTVDPAGAPVGISTWFSIGEWPGTGTITRKGPRIGALRNPKTGGVFHIGACFDGSPTNECVIVLPFAGASMDSVLSSDLARADTFAAAARAKYEPREINSAEFGQKWFITAGNGDYLGRPDSGINKCVWYYSQVNDETGQAGIGTLAGRPIRVAKLSNILAAYMCEKLDVSLANQLLSQLIGTTFDYSALLCWQAGRDIANGEDFDETIQDLADRNWKQMDARTIKPWPNLSPTSNHSPRPTYTNFNRVFYSPGMLSKEP